MTIKEMLIDYLDYLMGDLERMQKEDFQHYEDGDRDAKQQQIDEVIIAIREA